MGTDHLQLVPGRCKETGFTEINSVALTEDLSDTDAARAFTKQNLPDTATLYEFVNKNRSAKLRISIWHCLESPVQNLNYMHVKITLKD
ncbi:hypothetical protein AAVH_42137 [Aphelenchoides avenae]|nr:hypothetical protein AAVH_42137 [Aphelenchus avenae]